MNEREREREGGSICVCFILALYVEEFVYFTQNRLVIKKHEALVVDYTEFVVCKFYSDFSL